jgi:phosphoglycerate kinase
MRPVATRLAQLTGAEVKLAPDVVGDAVDELVDGLEPGAILLLENVRYEPGETKNDPELARRLGKFADVYVNDAFGAAHRAHASTEGVTHAVGDHAAGCCSSARCKSSRTCSRTRRGRWWRCSAARK